LHKSAAQKRRLEQEPVLFAGEKKRVKQALARKRSRKRFRRNDND